MQQTSCNKESKEEKNVHIQYMRKDKNSIKNSNKIKKRYSHRLNDKFNVNDIPTISHLI